MISIGWRRGAVLAVLVLGVAAGRLYGAQGATSPAQVRLVIKDQQLERELFAAIEQHLAAANLPKQDMPKRIIRVEQKGEKQYTVQMAMYQGEAWFDVSRQDGSWQVRGINPPE